MKNLLGNGRIIMRKEFFWYVHFENWYWELDKDEHACIFYTRSTLVGRTIAKYTSCNLRYILDFCVHFFIQGISLLT